MSQEIKEEFCGACVSSAIALVSAGSVGYSAINRKKGETEKKRKIAFWGGIIGLLISIFLYIKYADCKECQ